MGDVVAGVNGIVEFPDQDADAEVPGDSAPEVLAVAAAWLGCLRGRNALQRLEGLLRHPDVAVRAGAIDGLKCLGDPRAVPALVEVLLQPPTAVPRPFYVENNAVKSHDDETTPKDTLQRRSALAIDEIAGTSFDGHIPQIQSWLAQHPELQQPQQARSPAGRSE